jgi:hypothetical protein
LQDRVGQEAGARAAAEQDRSDQSRGAGIEPRACRSE